MYGIVPSSCYQSPNHISVINIPQRKEGFLVSPHLPSWISYLIPRSLCPVLMFILPSLLVLWTPAWFLAVSWQAPGLLCQWTAGAMDNAGVFHYLICERWETQRSVTCNNKMTECAKLHPSCRHPKGFKKARVLVITCSSVPDVGGFSVSPINPTQCAHSLAVWKEPGIKLNIFRHASQSSVVTQWLSHPLSNTTAAQPVRMGFLQQPHF